MTGFISGSQKSGAMDKYMRRILVFTVIMIIICTWVRIYHELYFVGAVLGSVFGLIVVGLLTMLDIINDSHKM